MDAEDRQTNFVDIGPVSKVGDVTWGGNGKQSYPSAALAWVGLLERNCADIDLHPFYVHVLLHNLGHL
jgi:hypothetical protein